MIEGMRRASKSWIAAVFIGVLVLSFALFGISDIFNSSVKNTVATVGDIEISDQLFARELQTELKRMEQQQGYSLTVAEAHAFGIDRNVLERVIARVSLDMLVGNLGMRISDDTLRGTIMAIPAFQGVDGKFDINGLNQYLRSAGVSQPEFEKRFRADTLRQQLISIIFSGVRAPSSYVAALKRFVDERRNVEYVVLSPDQLDAIGAPDDAALQAFLAEYPDAFKAPEYRSYTAIAIGVDQLTDAIAVSDEEVAADFDARSSQFNTPEKRVLEQVVFRTREEAEAASVKIAAGSSFAAIATEAGYSEEDRTLGEVAKGDPVVPATAFDVAAGVTTAPSQTPFGWVIVHVVSIKPGMTKTLAEMRDTLVTAIKRNKALDELAPYYDSIEDARGARTPFEEIAQRLNLRLIQVAAMDALGKDPSGVDVTGIPGDPQFIRDVFAIDAGEESDTRQTQDGILYAIRMDGVTPSSARQLADIRDQVVRAWRTSEASKRLDTLATDLATRASSGTDIAALARELGVSRKTAEAIERATATDDLPASIVALLFRAKPGEWVTASHSIPVAEGETGTPTPLVILARTVSVSFAAPVEGDAALAELGSKVAQGLAQDFVASFVTVNENAIGVEINSQALAKLAGEGDQ